MSCLFSLFLTSIYNVAENPMFKKYFLSTLTVYLFLKEEKKWGGGTRFWTMLSSHVCG